MILIDGVYPFEGCFLTQGHSKPRPSRSDCRICAKLVFSCLREFSRPAPPQFESHCPSLSPLSDLIELLNGLGFPQGQWTVQRVARDFILAHEGNARPARGVTQKLVPDPHHLPPAA